MAKTKNKNISTEFHTSRPRVKSSRLSSSKKFNRQIFDTAKRSIIMVIILAMLVVILAIPLSAFQNPEYIVKHSIESMTTDYYENYFYPRLIGTTDSNTSLDDIMSPYVTHGFAIVSLRQLLLFDDERYANLTSTLTEYCNENSTFVRIYPDEPFGKTNYHVDYHYSCEF